MIVVNGRVRRHVKALLERNFANMVVLSYSEIVGGVQLENLETLELYETGQVPNYTTEDDRAAARLNDDDLDDVGSMSW